MSLTSPGPTYDPGARAFAWHSYSARRIYVCGAAVGRRELLYASFNLVEGYYAVTSSRNNIWLSVCVAAVCMAAVRERVHRITSRRIVQIKKGQVDVQLCDTPLPVMLRQSTPDDLLFEVCPTGKRGTDRVTLILPSVV